MSQLGKEIVARVSVFADARSRRIRFTHHIAQLAHRTCHQHPIKKRRCGGGTLWNRQTTAPINPVTLKSTAVRIRRSRGTAASSRGQCPARSTQSARLISRAGGGPTELRSSRSNPLRRLLNSGEMQRGGNQIEQQPRLQADQKGNGHQDAAPIRSGIEIGSNGCGHCSGAAPGSVWASPSRPEKNDRWMARMV